jgi:BirA family transcriptional regulator, biotin operon repressor / biotin---[acetyl-CoA-carboxylase] ligase
MGERSFEGITLPPGYRLEAHGELTSTSDEAKKCAREGASSGLWVVAERQTKGRGRLGRSWVSGQGNLYASLLFFPAMAPARFPELSFAAALAVAKTLKRLAPSAKVRCKWPNDVLIEGKKASGILVEAESSGDPAKPWAVIGVGINVETAPSAVDFPATALLDFSTEKYNKYNVFTEFSKVLAETLTLWGKEGFTPIRTQWLNLAWRRGESLTVETGGEAIPGVFEGVSASGALILRQSGGQCREIVSGTVLKGA